MLVTMFPRMKGKGLEILRSTKSGKYNIVMVS